MRSILISFASIIAALSLFSVGAFAESSDGGELPTACQLTGAPAMPSTTVTTVATVTPTATTATNGDEVSDEAKDTTDHAMSYCVATPHDGDAANEAEHGSNNEDAASPVVHATASLTSTTASPVVVATSTPTTTTAIVASVSTAQTHHAIPVAQHGHSQSGQDNHAGQHGGDDSQHSGENSNAGQHGGD